MTTLSAEAIAAIEAAAAMAGQGSTSSKEGKKHSAETNTTTKGAKAMSSVKKAVEVTAKVVQVTCKVNIVLAKAAYAGVKKGAYRTYTTSKDVACNLYSKGKDFFASRTGRRVLKAGLAMASVATAGLFTTGTLAAALGGFGMFGLARIGYNLAKGKVGSWTFKDVLVNWFKDAAYVGLVTVGYVYASPYLMQGFVMGAVWLHNLSIQAINALIYAWAYVGYAIVA